MAEGFNFRIDFDDLFKKTNLLHELSDKELLNIYNKSLSKASIQTVIKEARRDLRSWLKDSTGDTAKSLGVKSARRKPMVMMGARMDNRYNGQLIHILDGGTQQRTTKKGMNRGQVLGLNFYANALSSKMNQLVEVFVANLKINYMKKIINRL